MQTTRTKDRKKMGKGNWKRGAIDINLLLHLAKVQLLLPCYHLKIFCKEKIVVLFVKFGFLISSGDSSKSVLYAVFIDKQSND